MCLCAHNGAESNKNTNAHLSGRMRPWIAGLADRNTCRTFLIYIFVASRDPSRCWLPAAHLCQLQA
jgi:hypothetical protein